MAALAWPEGLRSPEMKAFGPLGIRFDPTMIVSFSAGLVIASNQMYMRLPFFGVLTDVSSDHVGDWKVFSLSSAHSSKPTAPVSMQYLRGRKFKALQHDFMMTLLVLTRLSDGSLAWYPFGKVNPLNLVSYTRRTEPLACGTDGLQEQFDALGVPQPIAHGVEGEPFLPEDGYILRQSFLTIESRRGQGIELQSFSASDEELASEVGDLIGSMPPGHDDVDFTDSDLEFRDAGRLYPVKNLAWSEASLRRFFCASANRFSENDFELPELIEVMSLRGSDAILCCFKHSSRIAWVSSTVLRGELPKLLMFKDAVAKQKNKDIARRFNEAVRCARNYRDVVGDFVDGRDRAPSPLAWTAKEEEEYTGLPLRLNAEDAELLRMGKLLEEAEAILKDRASTEVMDEQGEEALNQGELSKIDHLIDKRFRELIKTDPHYVALVKKRSLVGASKARRERRLAGKDVVWDPHAK